MAVKTFYNKKHAEDSIKALSIVADALNKHNVKFYLDFGTLIGAMREKALIPWDHDIDISLVDEHDYSKIPEVLNYIKKNHNLRTYLFTFESAREKRRKRKKPILSENVSFTDDKNYSIAKIRNHNFLIFGRGSACIDIFFKYEKGGLVHWYAFGKENSAEASKLGNNFIEISFYGKKFWIPENYDAYLTSIYGEWKTPKEDWSHEQDGLTAKN